MIRSFSSFVRFARAGVLTAALMLLADCTGTFPLGPVIPPDPPPVPNTQLDLAVAVSVPDTNVSATSGSKTNVQWADIASLPGTVIRVQAQREATNGNTVLHDAFTGPLMNLIGDGTPGSGRDAIADGDNDKFSWDLTGVRIGSYRITVIIEAPDGTTETAISDDPDRNTNGVITITTTLPAPTLNFTAPGAADVTVHANNTFNITWTDNGSSNSAALLRLALDPDTSAVDPQHNSGNEITLLSNDPLSTSGNAGQFTFAFTDVDGNPVPLDTYTVFAVLDDNAHDPVTVSATGRLILQP